MYEVSCVVPSSTQMQMQYFDFLCTIKRIASQLRFDLFSKSLKQEEKSEKYKILR